MTAAVARYVPAARDALWAHPEWWLVVLGLAAWIATIRAGLAQWGHEIHHRASVAGDLTVWLVMVTAMMLPVTVFQAREVAFRSIAERRHQSMALFLTGYLAPWAAFGAGAAALQCVSWTASPWTVAALCALAAAWAMSPVRDRAMTVVYSFTPAIAPDGWRWVRDSAGAGATVGSWCIVSCWPLMLACAFSGHDLVIVIAGGLVTLIERRSFRPPIKLVVATSSGLAVLAIL